MSLLLFFVLVQFCLLKTSKSFTFISVKRMNQLSVQNQYDHEVDVAVVGGGIAGTTISWLLQEQQSCSVAIIDAKANATGTWYPNYGEWRDEWHTLSERMKLPQLKECTTTEWEITDCFFGGSYERPMDERLTLPRSYVRVDRIKLQALLRSRFEKVGGSSVTGKLQAQCIAPNIFDQNLHHDKTGSTLTLDNGETLRCKVLVDATGFESRLAVKESTLLARGNQVSYPTGYQIAYGFIAHLNNLGPYDPKAMTLFDYRTSFLEDEPDWLKEGTDKPTFMYVMPLSQYADGSYRVFLEETSLVGKGPRRLTFQECKRRAYKRLAFHGIEVLDVEEEEYCYIPMGGELPERSQRVITFGAAANMVHPSTGYQACRMLAASTDVAEAIGRRVREGRPPDEIASVAYAAMWGKKNRRQRDFQAFGGDFLMAQPVQLLRGFFMAFFSVEQPVWAGFLAGWPGLPGNENHDNWRSRLIFALKLFVQMPTDVKLAMILFAIKHTIQFGPNTLLRSLAPDFVFGSVPDDPLWQPPAATVGDEGAKTEARDMMRQFAASHHTAAKKENKRVIADTLMVAPITDISSSATDFVYPSPFDSLV